MVTESVGFGDDPELGLVGGVIHREQPGSVHQGGVIRGLVVRAAVAPVALHVPGQRSQNLLVGDLGQCVGCGHKSAKVKLRGAHRR